MIRRTAQIAAGLTSAEYVVATDDAAIETHCQKFDLPVVMTDSDLPAGSDRTLSAANLFNSKAGIIVNLQGDAPFTDRSHILAILKRLEEGDVDIATPAIQLSWEALDQLRSDKETTPFSGTTVIESEGRALWFSKTIIPAIRAEKSLRSENKHSPILRHVGLYGYRRDALAQFTKLPQSHFEKLEGLEQLRALENGLSIAIVKVPAPHISMPGIDTKEDLSRAEALIEKHGDPFFT